MKLFIDSKPLKNANAGRGVGHYTRMLIEAIRTHTNIELVDSWERADVVHYPFFDLFFLTLPFSKPKPTVVTVHDVIPLLYPNHYPKGLRGAAKQFIQTMSLSGAHRIVTDSDCSTADVIRYLKQPKEKVETVYLAPDPGYSPASKSDIEAVKNKYGLDKPYFLYVGDINYNKNLPELLEHFSKLSDEYLLVMVSKPLKRDNPAADFLWKEIDQRNLESRMRILSDVPIEAMRAIYGGSFWYVQPSLYEGFGLPVLEAQACGCPVISTSGGSLKEIAGVSCLDFDLIKSAIEVDRNQFIQLGFQNVDRFSWVKTAKKMEAIYERIL
jgi:glycosyltransferase involved in cell wall biosynthesis